MHLRFCLENMLALAGHYAIILGILPDAPPPSLQFNAGSLAVRVMVIMEGRIHSSKGTSRVHHRKVSSFLSMDVKDDTIFNLDNNSFDDS